MVFFVTLRIPPFQDLYRRYVDSYYIYTANTTLADALSGKIDYLFYFNSWFFYKTGMPFYLIPAGYAALSTYMILSSAYDMWKADNQKYTKLTLIVAFLSVFSFVDFIMIASTLRFGFAVALTIKALSFIYVRKKSFVGILLLLVAISCHVSMLIVVVSIVLNKFIKVSTLNCFILSVIAYLGSAYIVPYLLGTINLWGLSQYINNGYIQSDYASVTTNINTLIVQSYKWILLLLFFCYFCCNKKIWPAYENHLKLLIIICSCSAISATILNRYFIGLVLPIIVIAAQGALSNINKKGLFQLFSIIVIIVNISFVNIYLERRQILLGKLWYGLFTPPAFSLMYNMEGFNSYLIEIDEDGNWIKNKVAE